MYQVDAFTDTLFHGNPAAIVPLEHWLLDETMQNIAAENNLSETAFFVPKETDYELRWFTPGGEVSLCGHATLATAFVIFHHLEPKRSNITFFTKGGILMVFREGDLLTMLFPPKETMRIPHPELLVQGLGKRPIEVQKGYNYLAVYETEEEISALRPDFDVLRKLDAHGVIVTARGRKVDFVSRYFAPKLGVNEDPVTGSAHCSLVPYWSKIMGKTEFTAYQLSSRGGKIICSNLGERIKLTGEAVLYSEGTIYLPN